MALDIDNYSAPAGTRLVVPGHVSPEGGQTTSPSVVRFDTPWNGYEYWMAHTPHPGGDDAHSDPNIVASHDGTNWEVPAGITNPMDDQPGSPGAYNTDASLVYQAADDALFLFWRTVDTSLSSNQEKIYYRSSTDGATWTAKALAMQATSPGEMQLVSPALLSMGTTWYMLAIDYTASPRLIRGYSSTTTPDSFTEVAPGSTVLSPDGYDLLRMSVSYDPSVASALNGMVGVGVFGAPGSTEPPLKLHLMHSNNIWDWSVGGELVPQGGEWHNLIHSATLVASADSWGNAYFDIWYGGVLTGPPSVWNILRTSASPINDVIPPTQPTGVTVTPAPGRGRTISWTAADDDRGVAAYHVERDGVVAGVVDGDTTTFDDLGSPLSEAVNYRVAALDGAGNITWSAVTGASPDGPVDPTPSSPFSPGTAIEVRILGDGATGGRAADVEGYSITEDGTPLNILEGGGGVGSISVTLRDDDNPLSGSALLRNQPFEVYDPNAGIQRGVIDSLSAQDGILSIDGYSGTLTLVARKTAAPYAGSLAGAFYYYFSLGGVTSGVSLASGLESIDVALPPWNAVVWEKIHTLATIHGLEVANVAGVYTVRYIREERQVDMLRLTDAPTLECGSGEAAAKIVLEYQEKRWEGNGLAYPNPNESILDRQVLSVEAGELLETNIPVNAYLTSLEQPTHVMYGNQVAPPVSQYSVVDKNDRPVSPQDWANAGGYLSVEIGEDAASVNVTVRGAYTQSRAPYRIASVPGGTSYAFGALYLRGSGVFFEDREIWTHTGADPDLAPADSEIRISDPLISTAEEAHRMLTAAALARAGSYAEISVNAATVNRRGSLGISVSMTFDEFEAEFPDETFDDFEAEFPDETFDEFDDLMMLDDRTLFDNQAFGGIAGARTRFRDAIYRIDSVTAGPGGYQWSASADTTFDEFEEVDTEELTFDDFEALWPTQSFDDFDLSPLYTAPTG